MCDCVFARLIRLHFNKDSCICIHRGIFAAALQMPVYLHQDQVTHPVSGCPVCSDHCRDGHRLLQKGEQIS